jgi:regulator of sigma E protease
MSGILFSVAAFVVAIGVLVTVHEYGHFWVARKVGVKVLRFSVGFGKPLWRRQSQPDGTEFVVAAIPLGGYVKMLDEREGKVEAKDLHRAFNRKPLASRMAVVAAGPLFNFLFAIAAYWLMFVTGVPGLKPVLAEPVSDSVAAQAGLQLRDQILTVDGEATPTWNAAVISLLDAALSRRPVELEVADLDGTTRRVVMDLAGAEGLLGRGDLLRKLGLAPWRPPVPAVIDKVVAGGAADTAGLAGGDVILRADGTDIGKWSDWVDYVRDRPGQTIQVDVERDGVPVALTVRPEPVEMDDTVVGRIGAYVHIPEELGSSLRTEVRYGPLRSVPEALGRTWHMAELTLRTLWKMLTGEASVENISGPISIAQYAGYSAQVGFASFLGFLAIVSISLGVLNLLPIPVLDGGHLLYYLIELVKGSPVSEQAEMLGQRIGIALLLLLMSVAVFNDFTRLFR